MMNRSKVFTVVNTVLLALFTIMFIVPFITVIVSSLSTAQDVAKYGYFQLFPRSINFDAYKMLLNSTKIYTGYLVTIFRVVVGTSCSLAVTIGMSYALSKKYLKGRNLILTLVFITMIFSGGLIPLFIVVKALGLYNNIWVLIALPLVNSYNLIVMKSFFQEIPTSIEESAKIDGAGHFTILTKIVMQIALPSIVTIGLFYAVAQWNSWFDAAVFIRDYDKMPIQIILRDIIVSSTTDKAALNIGNMGQNFVKPPNYVIKSAAVIVTTVPILLVYPFIQKYFVKGIMIGSIKG
jgi:putative aldouronate transport system permease protein